MGGGESIIRKKKRCRVYRYGSFFFKATSFFAKQPQKQPLKRKVEKNEGKK